ncbi:hypothetical protein KKE92_00380 [Candidatus Micrarchaeota archaeon]|nr:hypothetical protein [Candidatus Micrarchaeota archaeon]
MAKKRLSREEKRQKLERAQSEATSIFHKDGAVETLRSKPVKPSKPKSSTIPVLDLPPSQDVGQDSLVPTQEQLFEMDASVLLEFARGKCTENNVSTSQQLFSILPEIGVVLAQRDLLGPLFETKPAQAPIVQELEDATRMVNGQQNKAKPPPVPDLKRRRSIPPPPPPKSRSQAPPLPPSMRRAIDNGPVSHQPTSVVESGDFTITAGDLSDFINNLRNSAESSKEKFERGKVRYAAEVKKLVGRFGEARLSAIEESVRSKKEEFKTKPEKEESKMEPQEIYVNRLLILRGLVTAYGKASKQHSQANVIQDEMRSVRTSDMPAVSLPELSQKDAKDTIPGKPNNVAIEEPKSTVNEPQEPVLLEVPKSTSSPQNKESKWSFKAWFKNRVSSPMTWAVLSVGGFSTAAHLTGAYQTMLTGFTKLWVQTLHLPTFELPEHSDKAIPYGILVLTLAATELIRRRKVTKELVRLQRRSDLSKDEEEACDYIVQKFTQIKRTSADLGLQLANIKSVMKTDEVLFDVVDVLFRHEIVWNDLMDDVRLDERVRRELPTVIDQVERVVVGKRLAQLVVYIDHPERRKTQLKALLLADKLFSRKMAEVFEKADGTYKNRPLRERLADIKYETSVPSDQQRQFITDLEEDYALILAESGIQTR